MRAVKFTQKQLDAGVVVQAKGNFRPFLLDPIAPLPFNALGLLCDVRGRVPVVQFEVGSNRIAEELGVSWRFIELVK